MATARALLISLAALCLPALANIPHASLLTENLHQGLADVATIPHQADAPANPLIAPSLPVCLCDEGRRTSITGKERDAETGLDYFLARYYSGAQGRFTSPDEWAGGVVDAYSGGQVAPPGPLPYADIGNPQSLNKYSYVLNNPLRYTDPDGHCIPLCLIPPAIGLADLLGIGVAGGAIVGTGYLVTHPEHLPEVPEITYNGQGGGSNFGIGADGGFTALVMKMDNASAKQGGNAQSGPGTGNSGTSATPPNEPYKRPNNATTKEQRASVQGQPCELCGATGQKNVAGHKQDLVKEYYTTGSIDKTKMRSVGAVRPECPTCSAQGGARAAQYSRQMKRELFPDEIGK